MIAVEICDYSPVRTKNPRPAYNANRIGKGAVAITQKDQQTRPYDQIRFSIAVHVRYGYCSKNLQ